MMKQEKEEKWRIRRYLFRNMWETVPKRGKWMQKKIDYF